MRKAVLLAGAMALATALPAKADQFFFDNYCITGSLQVCASVRVFTGPGNTLRMQVWNLAGVTGIQHTITSLGLYHAGAAWNGTVTGFSASYVTASGSTDISSSWQPRANDIGNLAGVRIEVAAGSSGNDGVIGCGTDPGGGTHWATCASFAAAPYVEFEFVLSQAFALDNLELRWHSQQIAGDNSLKCDTGGAGDYPPCTIVPEPITLALLATGLAGLGGVGLARRRRGFDVTDG